MFFLMPLSRGESLVKPPWATLGLIAATILSFAMTWPGESRYNEWRSSKAPLTAHARSLADLALDPGSPLSGDARQKVTVAQANPSFPTPAADRLLRRLDAEIFSAIPSSAWHAAYAAYAAERTRLESLGVPEESIFDRFGFDPARGYFPGIVTHMFLHAGFFHLLSNMFFLWLVGSSIEERWGLPIFLSLYFLGGAAAAAAQEVFHSVHGIGSVGASGAVAAIMGAFLLRHFKMPIRMFYFMWLGFRPKTGTFTAPAWSMLLLWAVEQTLRGLLTIGTHRTGVAYWAHLGGFLFGMAAGALVRWAGWAASWEKQAESTQGGLEMRLREVRSLFNVGKVDEARRIVADLLAHSPADAEVLAEAVRLHEYLEDKPKAALYAARAAQAALKRGLRERATGLMNTWLPVLRQHPLPDKDQLALGQTLTDLLRFDDALEIYSGIVKRPLSPLTGKAVFLAGTIYRDHLGQPGAAAQCFKVLLNKPFDLEWSAVARAELKSLDPAA